MHTLIAAVPTVANAPHYARIVHDTGRSRRAQQALARATQIIGKGARGEDLNDQLAAAYLAIAQSLDDETTNPAHQASLPPDIDTFLAHREEDDVYNWLIPGLLEHGDRLIVTGPEGGGKSTFLRQLAIQTAAGIHPFTLELNEPARVLLIDLENSAYQTRRKLRPLRLQAGDFDPQLLRVECRPQGLDLTNTDDVTWLRTICDTYQPNMLAAGPIYKMSSGDPNDEMAMKPVAMTYDRIRADTGTAVILEAHTPHAQNGQRKRPRRPYGWTGWMRWPEFGIHLDDDGTIEHWRGMRDERHWPTLLGRGGTWPWTPVTDPAAVLWARIQTARTDFGESMSIRDLEASLGQSRSTIHRAIKAHEAEWAILNGDPE